MKYWLLVIVVNSGVIAHADLDSTVKAIAACSISQAHRLDTSEVLNAEAQLADARFQTRPKLHATATLNHQKSHGAAYDSNAYAMELAVPVLDRSAQLDVHAHAKNVEVEQARNYTAAYALAHQAILQVVEIAKVDYDIQILEEEKADLSVLTRTLTSAGRIGVGDSADAMLAEVSLERLLVNINNRVLEAKKLRAQFAARFGYTVPAVSADETSNTASADLSKIFDPSIRTLNLELEHTRTRLAREKSYLLPKLSLTGGVISDRGAFPYDGQYVGLTVDLSGLLRGNGALPSLQAQKRVTEAKKQKQLQVLKTDLSLHELELDTTEQQLEGLANAIVTANKTKDLAKRKVEMGRLSYNAFLDVQEVLRSLKRGLSETKLRRLRVLMERSNRSYFSGESSQTVPVCSLAGQSSD